MGFNYFCKHIQERSRWPSSTDIEKYCMVWPFCKSKNVHWNLFFITTGWVLMSTGGTAYSGCPVHCYFYGNVKGWKKLKFTWTIANGATTKFKIVLYCRYLTQKTLFAVGFCFSWGALAIEIMSTTGSKPSCRCPVVLRFFIWNSSSLYN